MVQCEAYVRCSPQRDEWRLLAVSALGLQGGDREPKDEAEHVFTLERLSYYLKPYE